MSRATVENYNYRGRQPYAASSGVGATVNTVPNTQQQKIKGEIKFKMDKDIVLLIAMDGILAIARGMDLIDEDGFMKFKIVIAVILLLKVFVL